MPSDTRLLKALRCETVDATPVWFMRQAGRYLPEYRALRAERDILEMARDPETAAAITMQPLERFDLDAAVLFSDLSVPFLGAGLPVEIRGGIGPVLGRTVRSGREVDALEPFDVSERLDFVLEEIRILRREIKVPLIGFVGGPFTLVSYLAEGRGSRSLPHTKRLMLAEPEAWQRLLGYWTRHLAAFAVAQHEAGAAAIQVFDSWAGQLAPADYERFVLPHSQALLSHLAEAGVPTIHFATGNPLLHPLLARAGGDAIGVDWRTPLDEAWRAIGHDRAIQGNLDPAALCATPEVAVRAARDVLARAAGRPGHVFNLGHGMLPEAEPESVAAVVEAVHAYPEGAS